MQIDNGDLIEEYPLANLDLENDSVSLVLFYFTPSH